MSAFPYLPYVRRKRTRSQGLHQLKIGDSQLSGRKGQLPVCGVMLDLLGWYDFLSLLIVRNEFLFVLSRASRVDWMRGAPGEAVVTRNGLCLIPLS